MTSIAEQQQIAKNLKGILGTGSLNWLGNFNMETKKDQFSIFFNKESIARKAMKTTGGRLVKTPSFVNSYFKWSVCIESECGKCKMLSDLAPCDECFK